jgi:hypothetical protein
MSVSYGGDSIVFADGSVNSSGFIGHRNRIINGAMVIDQRNAGASVTPTDGQYILDRWQFPVTASSKFSVQQNAGAVTPPTGFSKYLGVTSLSAYSVGTGDYLALQQNIEGFNTSDLNWGTAFAVTVTISFWVRSSLTGTFGGVLKNAAANRSYSFTYTISSANTWEQKSITIAGDTSGTWVGATNGTCLSVIFGLGVGSTYSGTAGTWAAGNYVSATGATSVVGTNGATWYITGVQLERGSTASSFEYRPYGTELALCQRYFVLTNPSNSLRVGGMWGTTYTSGSGAISGLFPVPMRAAPTFTTGGTYNSFYMSNVTATSAGTFVNLIASTTCFSSEISGMSASSVGQPIQYNGQLSITAEL